MGILPLLTEVYHQVDDGLLIAIRVTPKSSADRLDGLYQGADGRLSLKLKVRAQPEKGRANQAVIVLMAKALGYPKSRFEIIAGVADRQKNLLVKADKAQANELMKAMQRIIEYECSSH